MWKERCFPRLFAREKSGTSEPTSSTARPVAACASRRTKIASVLCPSSRASRQRGKTSGESGSLRSREEIWREIQEFMRVSNSTYGFRYSEFGPTGNRSSLPSSYRFPDEDENSAHPSDENLNSLHCNLPSVSSLEAKGKGKPHENPNGDFAVSLQAAANPLKAESSTASAYRVKADVGPNGKRLQNLVESKSGPLSPHTTLSSKTRNSTESPGTASSAKGTGSKFWSMIPSRFSRMRD
ncbi:hypothetical protein R1flu_009776 [Riccia fluitans]|uniref:Uncharacterized protein n=1 Tax=Riccia fluitans TaxID=41844 RepID=A0ABD1Z462_9MARC